MNSIRHFLINKFQQAIQGAFGAGFAATDPMIQMATRAEYGDYQANFAMRLAKQLQQKPAAIAEQVAAQLAGEKLFAKLEVSGPGFINIYLADNFLQQQLQVLVADDRLGIAKTTKPEVVTVDYSSANVAKEMHVGHLRSAIIGDAIVRILEFLGHTVIKKNHLGDWGTQFGMLIQYLIEQGWQQSQSHSISDLNALYKESKARFDNDAEFAEAARQRVVALQSGDEETKTIWQQLVAESEAHFQKVYERLGLLLTPEDTYGESFYNDMLPEVVAELEKLGVVEISEGAAVIFLPGFVDRDDKPVPYIVRKSDGGYLYATTDLAAAKYRLDTLHATRLIYVTDARQKQHFAMLFATLAKIGWATAVHRFEHVPFGTILGKDRKPFKTRSGETIKLTLLLDEAEKRASEIARAKNPDLTPDQVKHIAKVIGIGALKYSDLANDKVKDYIFDWDKMLSFDGNTAPYLQNAYVRIRSIFRKGHITPAAVADQALVITESAEHALAVKLLEFNDWVNIVAKDLSLHRLCSYLYELATIFHRFYEACPVLTAENLQQHRSRLLICDATARTLQLGLALLGIEVLDKM